MASPIVGIGCASAGSPLINRSVIQMHHDGPIRLVLVGLGKHPLASQFLRAPETVSGHDAIFCVGDAEQARSGYQSTSSWAARLDEAATQRGRCEIGAAEVMLHLSGFRQDPGRTHFAATMLCLRSW
jgi:hypothetical protein